MSTKIFASSTDQIKKVQCAEKRFPIPLLIALLFGLLFLSLQVGISLFLKPRDPALQTSMRALSTGEATPLNTMELDPGRFRISSKHFSHQKMQIVFDCPSNARYLMLRKGYDFLAKQSVANLKISIPGQDSTFIYGDSSSFTSRHFIPINSNVDSLAITIESLDEDAKPLVIDEIGLYENRKAHIKKSQRHFLSLFMGMIGGAALLGIFSHSLIKRKHATIYGTAFIFTLAIAYHLAALFILFSPEWGRDLKVHFASGTLQESPGCNANYGLYMASSILQGKGPMYGDMPPWCRMPGYGFVLALAGNASNLLQMAMNGVFLHIFLFALSLAFFFWAALKILSPLATSLISTCIAFLPFNFSILQIETVMPVVVLFCMGTSCLFIHQYEKKGRVSLSFHLLLHLSFALWFFLRTDVLPAWGIVSLLLYAKKLHTWKYFLIPTAFILIIGLPWALFKMPYTGEFSMTTNSIGASMMGGLWEIPHKFIWEPSDGSVFQWMEMQNISPLTKSGSNFAIKECVRFCFTYPFYTFSLMWHKFLLFADLPLNFGFFTLHWSKLIFLFVILFSLISRHKKVRTLLLSWPILFNVPVFFLFFASGGRFYLASYISLIVASSVLLLDPGFYQKIFKYRYRAICMLLLLIGIMKFGHSLDKQLINNDNVRYYAPFLDPNLSTLNVVEK